VRWQAGGAGALRQNGCVEISITGKLEPTHTPIAVLSNFGIQTGDIRKLSEAGITTTEALVRMTKRKLSNVKGVSDAKEDKLREAAYKKVSRPVGFQTAKDLAVQRESKVVKATTGCEELDAMFAGAELAGELGDGGGRMHPSVACGVTHAEVELVRERL